MQVPNRVFLVGNYCVVRLRQSLAFITLMALVINQHSELLEWKDSGERNRNLVKLSTLILLGINGSPAGGNRKRIIIGEKK